jgi:hypothetical protein
MHLAASTNLDNDCKILTGRKGFSKGNVCGFFDLLESVINETNIDALQIFNVDEAGFFTDQRRAEKVLGKKPMPQIDALSGEKRGVSMTLAYHALGSLCFP